MGDVAVVGGGVGEDVVIYIYVTHASFIFKPKLLQYTGMKLIGEQLNKVSIISQLLHLRYFF